MGRHFDPPYYAHGPFRCTLLSSLRSQAPSLLASPKLFSTLDREYTLRASQTARLLCTAHRTTGLTHRGCGTCTLVSFCLRSNNEGIPHSHDKQRRSGGSSGDGGGRLCPHPPETVSPLSPYLITFGSHKTPTGAPSPPFPAFGLYCFLTWRWASGCPSAGEGTRGDSHRTLMGSLSRGIIGGRMTGRTRVTQSEGKVLRRFINVCWGVISSPLSYF